MEQKVSMRRKGRYETEVTYELNGAVEDMVWFTFEKIRQGEWQVETHYNSNVPYAQKNTDKTSTFKHGYLAKAEVSIRAIKWKNKFEKLILKDKTNDIACSNSNSGTINILIN